jgi:phosphoribosylformylglycinamidine synthase
MSSVRALILRAPGANCDLETAYAFEQAGAVAERVHIHRLKASPRLLEQYQILAIPGGFTYGDDVAAGKILAVQLRTFLADAVLQFREAGKLILGICNGFQALLKAGLLVPPGPQGVPATLAGNIPPGFVDRWVYLRTRPGNCPFLQGYDLWEAPIAHGEGRFVCASPELLQRWKQAGQVVLTYATASGEEADYPANPNGSQGNVAGLCDASGRVLGLMPHPERHLSPLHHPQWTRRGSAGVGDGLRLFTNAVRFFQKW